MMLMSSPRTTSPIRGSMLKVTTGSSIGGAAHLTFRNVTCSLLVCDFFILFIALLLLLQAIASSRTASSSSQVYALWHRFLVARSNQTSQLELQDHRIRQGQFLSSSKDLPCEATPRTMLRLQRPASGDGARHKTWCRGAHNNRHRDASTR